MDVTWTDWQVVDAALRHGSFTAAAQALGVGQATVSRRVAAVEEALGHVLFDRHRTGLVPTEAARLVAPHLEALHTAAFGASHAIDGLEIAARGEVRITAPPGVAIDWIPTIARRLKRTDPEITLCVIADVNPLDLDRREADIALRFARTESGDLLVRRLLSFGGGLYATPEYVASLPCNATFAQLDIVQFDASNADLEMARSLASLGARVAFRSNDYLLLRAAVLAGLGAGAFGHDEAAGLGLVRVPIPLPEQPLVHLYLVVHRALRHAPRVAAVIDTIDALIAEREITP